MVGTLSIKTIADFAGIAFAKAKHVWDIFSLTIEDEQTGLYNARHLNFMLETEIYRCRLYKLQFSLVSIDIGGLKELSNSLSYATFKALLAEIGQKIKSTCRLLDLAFHFEDTEFELLLPQTSKESACKCNFVRGLAAYQDFLTLWKDADPDVPILKQAKAEYAKLQ